MENKNIFRKSKKSQGDVIALVLIILLCLAAALILWKVVFPMMQNTQEETKIRQDLSKTQMVISDVSGDLANPEGNQLTISLSRGSGEMNLENETIASTQKSPADIVSVVDLSGSMYYSEVSRCVGISEDSYCAANPGACCCQKNSTGQRIDCSKPEDCKKCNFGTIELDPVTNQQACIFHRTAPYSCWDELGDKRFDYSTPAGCALCGGSLQTKCSWLLPINNNIGPTVRVYEGDSLPSSSTKCNASGGDEIIAIPGEIGTTAYQKYCVVNTGQNGRCGTSPGHCLTETDCKSNNGAWSSTLNKCVFSYYYNTCCKKSFPPPTIAESCLGVLGAANCASCGGTFQTSTTCIYKSGSIGSTPCAGNSYFSQGMNTEEYVCGIGGYCFGKLNAIRRFDYAKTANNVFIDKVFSLSESHKMALVDYSEFNNSYPASGLYGSTQKSLLNDHVNAWTLTSTIASNTQHQNTNICKGLIAARDILAASSTPERYKAIVLMTDGNSNTYCDGIRITSIDEYLAVKNELNTTAENIYNNDNIHVFTIAVGALSDKITLQQMAVVGDGYSVTSDNLDDLSQLYDEIAYKINSQTLKYYKSEQTWNSIRVVVYNDTSSYTDIISDPQLIPEVLETRQTTINTGGLTNINKIEIYLVVKTESGKEISELIITWTPDSESSDYLPSY